MRKTIFIGDKEYSVQVAISEEEKRIGLSQTEKLEPDEGMLFDYSDNPQKELIFTMVDTSIPLDIIFINTEDEICGIASVEAFSKEEIECIADDDELLKYVLEVNINSGLKEGDELDIEDEESSDDEVIKMFILGPDGNPVMELVGGERIVSRKETKRLIAKTKKASKSKLDKDYKALGKLMFSILKGQDERPEEYVEGPEK